MSGTKAGGPDKSPAELGRCATALGADFLDARDRNVLGGVLTGVVADPVAERLLDRPVFTPAKTDDADAAAPPGDTFTVTPFRVLSVTVPA